MKQPLAVQRIPKDGTDRARSLSFGQAGLALATALALVSLGATDGLLWWAVTMFSATIPLGIGHGLLCQDFAAVPFSTLGWRVVLAVMSTAILFRFDSEQARDYFLSSEVFRVDSRIVHEVLETLANAKVPVQRDLLLNLISALDASDLKYPRTYALGEALRLLGQAQNPEDREFLTARLTHSEDRVAEGAAAGLLCSHGLEGFEKRIWKSEENSGYGSLPDHQRYYSAVFMCDAEINNGGLAQYFVNSSGDHCRDALAGLEAMGSKERLGVLREAISLFGPDGPSQDRDNRQEQLSKLYKKNDSIFEALDTRYYNSAEVVEVLATRFVLANPNSFR